MIQSAVAMSSKKVFSSSDAMQVDNLPTPCEQSSDNKENQTDVVMQSAKSGGDNERGKRVLGVLMGTLNRFKTEESENSEANLKRALLEQKLAQKLAREKELLAETMARERAEREEARNQALKARSNQIADEVEQLLLKSAECHDRFRKTQAQPALFWAPKPSDQ